MSIEQISDKNFLCCQSIGVKSVWYNSIISITICISLFAGSLVNAKENNSTKTSGSESGFNTENVPKAIRLSIVNGIIEYVKNAKQATIILDWELLPLDPILIKLARENYQDGEPVTCSIQNENLGNSSKWIQELTDKCKQRLTEALMVDRLEDLNYQEKINTSLPSEENFTLGSSTEKSQGSKFENFWTKDTGEGKKLVLNSGVTASQYFSLLRDHLQLKSLLSSAGIVYSINAPDAQGDFPRFSDKDIKWQIKIYRFPASKKINVYRFTAKATSKPFNLLYPDATDKSNMPLNVGISIKKSEGTIGILEPNLAASPVEINIDLSPNTKSLISGTAPTELNTLLSFLGGADLGKIVRNNFLGGTNESSIITGGLISDKVVEPLVGVNLELKNIGDVKGGFLFGVGTTNKAPLYIGPSLQYSVLTFSAGARIFEKNQATYIDPAGVFSIDLSQLLGGKNQITKLKIDNTKTGGNWGIASEAVAKDLAFISWTRSGSSILSFIKEKNCAGMPVIDGEKARFSIATASGSRFIPQGIYTNLSKSDELHSGPFPLKGDVNICGSIGVNELNF